MQRVRVLLVKHLNSLLTKTLCDFVENCGRLQDSEGVKQVIVPKVINTFEHAEAELSNAAADYIGIVLPYAPKGFSNLHKPLQQLRDRKPNFKFLIVYPFSLDSREKIVAEGRNSRMRYLSLTLNDIMAEPPTKGIDQNELARKTTQYQQRQKKLYSIVRGYLVGDHSFYEAADLYLKLYETKASGKEQ